MNALTETRFSASSNWAVLALFAVFVSVALTPSQTAAQSRLQAGVLSCSGEGGWGVIIGSTKRFRCTFASSDGSVRGRYNAVVSKFGLDIGVTGHTALSWLVFGPADTVGENYIEGSLEGAYSGVGVDAAVGLGVGANALVGGGPGSFALQPVSIQVQTGLSIAAGVQTLTLRYVGPVK